MTQRGPFYKFGRWEDVEYEVYRDGQRLAGEHYFDDTLWVERPEDMYALSASTWKGKRIRVIHRRNWPVRR